MDDHHRQFDRLAIRRRPVGATTPQQRPAPPRPGEDAVEDLLDDYFALPVAAPVAVHTARHEKTADPRGQLSVDTHVYPPVLRPARSPVVIDSPAELSSPTPPLGPPPAYSPGLTPETPRHLAPVTPDTPALDASSPSQLAKPFWKTAIDETIYFAGGLISHPAESTRHYTVLRHSPGLVYYKGPSTRVAITIFSDDGPLPPGRTLWLQRKGFSGNMGMDASTFFRTDSSWIDVTPTAQVLPSEIPPEDERAWQRDINKFLKKAANHKRLSKHRPSETCVIRVPASAADGYMRIVVCGGGGGGGGGTGSSTKKKKSLCPSPVFRVASTSRDMSVMRGASLRTLPLELGMRAATAIGEKYITTVAAPVVGVVQTGVKRVEPMVMSQNPRAMAAIRAGASEGLVMAEDRYAPIRHATWDSLYETSITDSPPEMVGSDDGPEHPFPIHMHGKVAKGTGRSRADTGFPTANLVGVPGNLLLRLGGVYVGWAAVSDQGRSYSERRDLHKAIVVVGPPMYGPVQVAAKNTAVAHLIQESGDPMPDMLDARIDIIIMAHLRPLLPRDPPPPPTRITAVMRENISVAIASLSRDTWHHRHQKHLLEAASVRNPLVKALKTHKSLGDFAAHASAGLQRRVDSVPLHWAGIRTEGSELKDHTYGTGGFYIKR